MTVAGQVNEPQIRVLPVDVRQRVERRERAPVAIASPLEEAGRGTAELDEVELPVSSQVEELASSFADQRRGRPQRDRPDGAESGVAEARLVEPRVRLLGEDARKALSIEVDESVGRPVDSSGRVLNARRVDVANPVVDDRLGVLELDRRQRRRDVPRRGRLLPPISGLRDRRDARRDGVAAAQVLWHAARALVREVE